ncbi:MAG: tryptophan synthase subunit alpha [SAR202 cluster bacterium]|nr:tryptophan synthase subunit alpha [SAR202 cluster bacterium]
MTNRIDQIIQKSKQSSEMVISSFITVGFPNKNQSIEIASTLLNNQVDLIELGMPFSDPIAEGPTIQKTSQIALSQGIGIDSCLEAATIVRKSNSQAGIILMGYFNPILKYGLQKFVQKAACSKVDGIIIPDLPIEESSELRMICKQYDIHLIPLIAPTSTPERIDRICEKADGFIYCVSVKGVTGARKKLDYDNLKLFVNKIREKTNLPILIGFGISTPEQVEQISKFADGVIVGSSLLNSIMESPNDQAVKKAVQFMKSLKPSKNI